MTIKEHTLNNDLVAEVIADDMVIKTVEDGTNLVGDLYYQNYNTVIIHQKNITPDFFILRTGVAGELLQKFSNYRIQLFIIGDFDREESKSLQSFIYESNKGALVNFVATLADAFKRLSIANPGS
ncbi:DUF4180 domain-containing protein [Pontibacter qinzhouensis]|uniref:DUF4180 domain-containing protein n=1 Tax=Pontibacter qinzhouensis TaxID=2603253 RepID=A0A5C8K6S8_9BACT|nr:DUF4180 domain-containing protein [Pontibacter qinzhouensis]TXK47560.1 DUF4180 domain-containing protein [Pontibacter qinzhouensis]